MTHFEPTSKPPIGAIPETIWRAARVDELIRALAQHQAAGRNVANAYTRSERLARDWAIELGKHVEWFKAREGIE